MFGYHRTNQPAIATRSPATNRRASRAVATNAARGNNAIVMISAIGSTGMFVEVTMGVSSKNDDATTNPRLTPIAASAAFRSLVRTGMSSSGTSSASEMRSRIRMSTPIPTTRAMAAARPLSRKSGMRVGHACEPGLAASTRTNPQSGRWKSHSVVGASMAAAPTSLASSHVRRDAPFHSSARK